MTDRTSLSDFEDRVDLSRWDPTVALEALLRRVSGPMRERLYVENARALLETTREKALEVLAHGVETGALRRMEAWSCPNRNCARVLLTSPDRADLPDRVQCEICEHDGEEVWEFDVAKLPTAAVYQVVDQQEPMPRLRVVAFEDEPGVWVAQCLDANLGAQAGTLDDLEHAFEKVLVGHMLICAETGRKPLVGLGDVPRGSLDMWKGAEEHRAFVPTGWEVDGNPLPWAVPTVWMRLAQKDGS